MRRAETYGGSIPGLQPEDLSGWLIVVEGTDGVGRTTHIDLLRAHLERSGYAVAETGLTRSDLASRGIRRAKQGNTLGSTAYNLYYATDFADRLEHQIVPALHAGSIVLADRYMYTAFARNRVMGADPAWTRQIFGFALVPDLVLYLEIDVEHLVPRVLEGKGMDYWESGMHLALGTDIFDSFVRYQRRLIAEYNALGREFNFVTIDARRPVEAIQSDLRTHVAMYLANARRRRRTPSDQALRRSRA